MIDVVIDNSIYIVVSLIVGVLVGIVVENYRLKHSLKIEKINRLAPHLEICSPMIEKILEDSGYALKILNRGQTEGEDLILQNKKIIQRLTVFQEWYELFQNRGMKFELESVNKELQERLVGLFNIAILSIKHGETYVSQNLKQIHDNANISNQKLQVILKA